MNPFFNVCKLIKKNKPHKKPTNQQEEWRGRSLKQREDSKNKSQYQRHQTSVFLLKWLRLKSNGFVLFMQKLEKQSGNPKQKNRISHDTRKKALEQLKQVGQRCNECQR